MADVGARKVLGWEGGCRLYASDRPPPLTPKTDPTDRKVFLVVQPGLYHGMQYASVRWLLASCLVVHGSRCQQAPIGQCSSAWVAGWLAGRPAGCVEAGRHAESISHGYF